MGNGAAGSGAGIISNTHQIDLGEHDTSKA